MMNGTLAVHGSAWLGNCSRNLAVILAIASLASCTNQDCPQPVLPSVSVTVVDAVTDENLANIATGTIKQGSFVAPFTRSGDHLIAGENRSGTFTVTLTAPGYQPWEARVYVESNACMITTKALRVALDPHV